MTPAVVMLLGTNDDQLVTKSSIRWRSTTAAKPLRWTWLKYMYTDTWYVMCTCVLVYIYIYICLYIYIHIYIYDCTYIYIYTRYVFIELPAHSKSGTRNSQQPLGAAPGTWLFDHAGQGDLLLTILWRWGPKLTCCPNDSQKTSKNSQKRFHIYVK